MVKLIKQTTVTAEDDAGTPQENVPVYAFAGEVYTGFNGVSDVNGEVTLTIPEDDYRYAPDLPAGSPPADVQITVTVEDTSSAPQVGLTVFALSGSDYNDYKTCTGRSDVTDTNGQVVLTLPQVGQYRFRVKNGSQSYYSDLAALCDPLTCSAITVTIPGAGGDVVVTATDGLGQAIADNMVYAFDEDTYTGIFAETDVNGQATLSLPEGDYRFRTEVDEQYFFSDTVNHCTPPTCASAQIAIPAVHAVTVSVQDDAANPQQDVVVYAFEGATYAEMSYTGISGKSDALGEVTFELPAGNYWFAYQQGDVAVDAGETAVCVLPGCTTSTLTTTQNGTTTYVYDPLNRLTGATEVGTATREYGFTYDAVGNRLTKTIDSTTVNYGYDIANRLTSVDSVTYTWDNNGNLLSDGVFTYTYDAMNRLASATDGVDTYAYAYNASGDRLQQTVNAVPTNYTLDLAAGLAQVLDDGTNAYLYGSDRIAQEDTNGMLYFIPDALGSVRKLVDANGDIVNAASYSPYGESAGMAETSYGFTGEWTDAMGLVNLRTRYYAPGDGRFVSRDTWKGDYNDPHSLNKWAYVEGNPINSTDPAGRYARPATGYYDGDDDTPDCILDNEGVNEDGQFCILKNGAFIDESHFGSGGTPHKSQTLFWEDLKEAKGKNGHPVPIEQSTAGYIYTGTYIVTNVPADISVQKLKEIGAGIFLDYQIRFEKWQHDELQLLANHSAFETADIPSTYLGYIAAVQNCPYEKLIEILGGGYPSDHGPKEHRKLSGYLRGRSVEECIEQGCDPNKHRNDALNLKAGSWRRIGGTGYTSLAYPNNPLFIQPAEDWEHYVDLDASTFEPSFAPKAWYAPILDFLVDERIPQYGY